MEEEKLFSMEWKYNYYMKFLGISFVVCLVVVRAMVYLWWRPRKIEQHFAKQGIRGPPYRFLIGNAKEILSLMLKASSQSIPCYSHNILPRVLPFYHHWKKIYGATILVWFGPTPRLAVADPDLIREIYTTKSEFYERNEAHPLITQLEGCKVIEMLEKWTDMLSKCGEVEIEVSECFKMLTQDIVAQTAFGSSYEQGKAIFSLQAQQMLLTSEALQKVFIPGYRFLPTKRNMKCWKLDREIKRSLLKVIEERREIWGSEIVENGPKDLLGLMIQASMKEGPSATAITVNDIAEECKTFFFAGEQTTSNLLTWTAVLLAMHPRWQDLAREEVVKVCGSRDIPSKDDIAKFKMLSMIMNESLRLYPPIVAMIRRAKADVELGGCKIPCGTELLIPILAIHHDQTLWGSDVNEFNPTRFAKGVTVAAKHPAAYIPFGIGVRQCVGQNLAILQTKITLAIILQRFSFRMSPCYQHAPTVLMLLHPQYGAPIIFRRV
nr:cytochrome P450 734A1-like [Ipomoea trifida]